MQKPKPIQSQITFLYYQEMAPAATFYEQVMGLELVEDQQWARIYHLGGNAFLGIVSGEKGFHKPQEHSAVLLTLVVGDVPGWYDYLKGQGVKLLTELQNKEDPQIQCFFFQDPGGYTFEVQRFLRPDLAKLFHAQV